MSIDFHLDPATNVLTVRPQSALDKSDFTTLAAAVDPQIEQHGDVAEHITSHFVSAQIRHFPAGGLDDAKKWISGDAAD